MIIVRFLHLYNLEEMCQVWKMLQDEVIRGNARFHIGHGVRKSDSKQRGEILKEIYEVNR